MPRPPEKKGEAETISIRSEVVEKVGAIEQLRRASAAASKEGRHHDHARCEMALFALHNLTLKLDGMDWDGAVAEIKALL